MLMRIGETLAITFDTDFLVKEEMANGRVYY
jgi:hypothetical protein